uniref:Scaffold attachment factor B2 n=1 Tax=Magallana gigas TaxID=29159 RepID=K1QME3_MAGGI
MLADLMMNYSFESTKKKASKPVLVPSCNLWVSGINSSTRANDLKALFNKHVKVVAAKIMTNARSPDSSCFGYIILSSIEDAKKCIASLNNTRLNGNTISLTFDKAGEGRISSRDRSVSSKDQGDKPRRVIHLNWKPGGGEGRGWQSSSGWMRNHRIGYFKSRSAMSHSYDQESNRRNGVEEATGADSSGTTGSGAAGERVGGTAASGTDQVTLVCMFYIREEEERLRFEEEQRIVVFEEEQRRLVAEEMRIREEERMRFIEPVMETGLGNQGIPQMTGLGASIEMRGEDIRHIMKIGSTETDTVQSGTKPGRKKSENGKSRGKKENVRKGKEEIERKGRRKDKSS